MDKDSITIMQTETANLILIEKKDHIDVPHCSKKKQQEQQAPERHAYTIAIK